MTKEQKLILMIKFNNQIAFKFIDWDVRPLEELKDSRPFELRLKILDGQELTREDKNYITENVNCNNYSKSGIPLQGWLFSFKKILNSYLVKQYGSWQEYNAIDKTSLRKFIGGKIDKIIINL
jgi:hypothetical protein